MRTKSAFALALALVVASASVGRTQAQTQGLGTSAHFPNLPNVLTHIMTRPRSNLQVPVIEPFIKDEATGFTLY